MAQEPPTFDTEVRWRGKRVKDMSREELEQAFYTLGRMYEHMTKQHAADFRSLRTIRSDDWHSTGQPVPYKPADGQW